jgi:hypothetical protein
LSADTAFDVTEPAVAVPTISFEFFPPKDPEGEQKLWQTIDELQEFKPDFVSMTYGAGGGTRDRTVRIASEFIAKTGVPVIGHLTCVGLLFPREPSPSQLQILISLALNPSGKLLQNMPGMAISLMGQLKDC